MQNNSEKNLIEDPKSIAEVFSTLHTRLDELYNYKKYFNIFYVLESDYDLGSKQTQFLKIPRHIKRFPEHAIISIDTALNEIASLLNRGISILDNISIGVDDPYPNMPVDEFFNPDPGNYDHLPSPEAYKISIFELVKKELQFYEQNLQQLRNEIQPNEEKTTIQAAIVLSEGVNLPQAPEFGEVSLDRYQTAVFFDYLRHTKVVQAKYSDKSLAKIASVLTGHSENTLRTEGFGKIALIKNDSVKNKEKSQGDFYNLTTIKEILQDIIDQINIDIAQIRKSKKNSNPL